MKEREIIQAIAGSFTRSDQQRNDWFASDAEILELDGSLVALTIDDYSAEDRFGTEDPRLLGWNLVTATVSDLLAVGARPRFMLNSLVVSSRTDAAALQALSSGMQEALEACGAAMAGGDLGSGVDWRFTGVALGTFRAGQVPLSRVVPRDTSAGAVMVTGTLGDANLAVGAGSPALRFEMRLAESAALADLAPPAACIDTSDGLVSALETLVDLNPDLRIEVDLAAVSLAPGVARVAGAMGVPPEVFLMGSAGEYELLALVPDESGEAIPTLARAGFRRIGTFDTGPEPGLHFRRDGDLIAHPGLPDPRAGATFDDYVADLIALAQRMFGSREGH